MPYPVNSIFNIANIIHNHGLFPFTLNFSKWVVEMINAYNSNKLTLYEKKSFTSILLNNMDCVELCNDFPVEYQCIIEMLKNFRIIQSSNVNKIPIPINVIKWFFTQCYHKTNMEKDLWTNFITLPQNKVLNGLITGNLMVENIQEITQTTNITIDMFQWILFNNYCAQRKILHMTYYGVFMTWYEFVNTEFYEINIFRKISTCKTFVAYNVFKLSFQPNFRNDIAQNMRNISTIISHLKICLTNDLSNETLSIIKNMIAEYDYKFRKKLDIMVYGEVKKLWREFMLSNEYLSLNNKKRKIDDITQECPNTTTIIPQTNETNKVIIDDELREYLNEFL